MIKYPHAHLFVRGTFALLFLFLVALFVPSLPFPSSLNDISVMTILLGSFGGLGLLLFAKALSTLPAKLVFFGGTFQLITGMIIGHLMLDERLDVARILVVLGLLVTQLVLISKDIHSWRNISKSKRWSPFLIGIIWGTYYPFIGLVESKVGIWQTIVLSEFGVFLALLVALLFHYTAEKDAFKRGKTYLDMFQQATFSLSAQSLTVLCVKLGGVIFQSILSSFSNLIYLVAFKLVFKEKYDLRYVLYFICYGLLVMFL